jgi:hypothetical protein
MPKKKPALLKQEPSFSQSSKMEMAKKKPDFSFIVAL